VSDISKYGDLAEVGKLILPKGISNVVSSSRTLQQDPVDTGTIRGVVSISDINIYKSEELSLCF